MLLLSALRPNLGYCGSRANCLKVSKFTSLAEWPGLGQSRHSRAKVGKAASSLALDVPTDASSALERRRLAVCGLAGFACKEP